MASISFLPCSYKNPTIPYFVPLSSLDKIRLQAAGITRRSRPLPPPSAPISGKVSTPLGPRLPLLLPLQKAHLLTPPLFFFRSRSQQPERAEARRHGEQVRRGFPVSPHRLYLPRQHKRVRGVPAHPQVPHSPRLSHPCANPARRRHAPAKARRFPDVYFCCVAYLVNKRSQP